MNDPSRRPSAAQPASPRFALWCGLAVGAWLGACNGEVGGSAEWEPTRPGPVPVAAEQEPVEATQDPSPGVSSEIQPLAPISAEPGADATPVDSAADLTPVTSNTETAPVTATPLDPKNPSCANRSAEIYERRIRPLLVDDRPTSCNQCHLSGVDLAQFVRPTTCETMACLQDLELVDLSDPAASTVLSWIGRATPDSPLITEEVIQAEYDGFLEWIEHASECFSEECAGVSCGQLEEEPQCPRTDQPGGPSLEQIDTGGCSELELERLFRSSVYAARGRCFPCHTEGQDGADPRAPRFFKVLGSCDQASLVTMRAVVDSGIVSLDGPDVRSILLKPLDERAGGVPHGGHAKFFNQDDPDYQKISYWVRRYAECQGGAL